MVQGGPAVVSLERDCVSFCFGTDTFIIGRFPFALLPQG